MVAMKRPARSLLGPAIAIVTIACSHSVPGTRAAPLDLTWSPFYWAAAGDDSLRFPQAAILLEVSLRAGPAPSLVQLDLAASGGMPDGFPSADRQLVRRTGELHGLLAGMTAISMRRGSLPAEDLAMREIGVFGLANYDRQGLIIDMRVQRLATFPPPADLSSAFGSGTVVVPIEFTTNRVLIPVMVGGSDTFRALLDSGLSPFPLWTTFALWQRLTGRLGPGVGTKSYRLAGRSGAMLFVGAPVTQQLRLGSWPLQGIEVVYLADGPAGAALESWPNGVDAVVGPIALTATGWIILDIPHRRLGLAPPRRR